MQGKKSFILYTEFKSIFNELPDEVAGRLIKHIFSYVNDENPETDDLIIRVAFDPIKRCLKKDLEKRNGICERNSNNGKKGGRPKKNYDNSQKPSGFSGNPNKPKKADNDNDNDNDIKEKVEKENLDDFLPPKELEKFLDYWGEEIQRGKFKGKQRWVSMKTWDTKKRMTTWKRKNEEFSKGKQPENEYERLEEFEKLSENWGEKFKLKYGKDKYFEVKKIYQDKKKESLLQAI